MKTLFFSYQDLTQVLQGFLKFVDVGKFKYFLEVFFKAVADIRRYLTLPLNLKSSFEELYENL